MNRILRTFFIFLLLLSTRTAFAHNVDHGQGNTKNNGSYAAKQAFSKNLDGLTAIQSMQYQVPRQTSADLDTLYSQANDAQQELAELLNMITAQSHTQSVLADIKSRERAQAKVQSKLNNDASQLTDIVRASIVSHDIHNLMQAFALLKSDSELIQVKNRFAAPKESGYRDLNLLVKLPQSQMIAEVQLHLADIAEIKSGAEHQVYEQVQTIQASAMQEQRDLSDIETAKITRLRQESHKLYHKAWLRYKRSDQESTFSTAA
ncbi:RelA/SpoT domain-containing protein [Shewanella schlegeliana]|uniref:RelA/SpoT domain-containing protein n=1 Tax=Shewanella schlegeliana TaxID=190308 RepID=A0ABS1T101_9GAMM|nr:RelA/SpoT domain-containing protein [Shewanella schlegeliana]MBL4914260.1 RelA/SpoT domain-containing protein [Shewanella schlegeliana]MCL1109517.1 RelA/SpoT domain-containing protein [Shewanella schlegeliana]GIU33655.1 GTP pyrophosphokinase [Shewanella schlegeliana]